MFHTIARIDLSMLAENMDIVRERLPRNEGAVRRQVGWLRAWNRSRLSHSGGGGD